MVTGQVFKQLKQAHRPSDAKTEKGKELQRTLWNVGKTSHHERDDLGVIYVHRKVKETKGRQGTNEKIRGIDIRMTSTSPSE